jgi:small GTP-binding protein
LNYRAKSGSLHFAIRLSISIAVAFQSQMDEGIEIKVILVGNTSVGKTCIVKRGNSGVFDDESVPTLGAAYLPKVVVVGQKEVRLHIWDTAGQERYRGMAPMYFRGAHVAVLVYSVCDAQSFAGVDKWVESLQDNADVNILKFLVANKIDLEDDRIVTLEAGQDKADSLQAHYHEVSAKTGYGIDDFFQDVAKLYLEQHSAPPEVDTPKVTLESPTVSKKKKSGCCK